MTTTTQTQPEGTYWHFLNADKRLRYSDGREVTVGETLKVEGEIELCGNGLHASKQAIDALQYAPGSIACLVTLGGNIIHGGDKSVARERTALWIFDAEKLLREFACTIAENALLAERTAGREPDPRCFASVEVTRQWIKGEATDEERTDAEIAAWQAKKDFESSFQCNPEEPQMPLVWFAVTGAAKAAAYAAAFDSVNGASGAAYAIVCLEESAEQDKVEAEQNEMLTSLLLAEYEKDKTP